MAVNIQDALSGDVVQVRFSSLFLLLYSNMSQDARLLDDILRQITTIQSRRPDINNHFSYRIEKKGDRDSRRRTKSLEIGILDEETKTLLQTSHQQWTNDPSVFWLQAKTYPTSQLPPIAQIASYYLQAQRADV